jgi:hypothetical protein
MQLANNCMMNVKPANSIGFFFLFSGKVDGDLYAYHLLLPATILSDQSRCSQPISWEQRCNKNYSR